MTLQDILRVKGSDVFAIEPSTRLGEVVRSLVEHKIGSLLICDQHDGKRRVLGIITERDILRACAERGSQFGDVPVTEYMTTEMITGSPENSVEHIMGVMTDHRIRHLPVMEEDQLIGLISIGDVVKAQYHQALVENHYLKSYISG
jgi:CBS domain-containing protein